MLINSTETLKAAVGSVYRSLTWTTVMSFVEQAEAKYLTPSLGRDFLDELEAANAPTADQTTLLRHLRAALANYAILESAPMLSVGYSDSGLTEAGNSGATPVRQWVYYNFIDAACAAGDEGLERALSFLEDNAGVFTTWADSEACRDARELFIRSGQALARYLNLPQPRRAYLALLPFLRRAEELYLAPLLGADVFEPLKARDLAGSLSTDDKILLALARPALAHRALAEAVPEIAIAIVGGGVRVLADHDGIRSRQTASSDQLDALARRSTENAVRYEERLKQHLDTVAPQEPQRAAQLPENDSSKGYFIV